LIGKDIDRDGQFKLYVQIYGVIRRMIEEGEWTPGSMIPSEDELCKIFLVSKTTIRLALADLVREGYLRRQQGKGTFVKSPVPNSGITMVTRVSEAIDADGFSGGRESLETGTLRPDEEISGILDFNGPVFYAKCRNIYDHEPTSIEELFVPLMYFPGIEGEDFCEASFFGIVRRRSLRKLDRIAQTIEAVHLKNDITALMEADSDEPALLLQRVFIDAEGKPIAYMRLFGRAGYYCFKVEFESIK